MGCWGESADPPFSGGTVWVTFDIPLEKCPWLSIAGSVSSTVPWHRRLLHFSFSWHRVADGSATDPLCVRAPHFSHCTSSLSPACCSVAVGSVVVVVVVVWCLDSCSRVTRRVSWLFGAGPNRSPPFRSPR